MIEEDRRTFVLLFLRTIMQVLHLASLASFVASDQSCMYNKFKWLEAQYDTLV